MTAHFQQGFDTDVIGAITMTLTETGGGGATGPISVEGAFFHGSAFAGLDSGWTVLATSLVAALNAVGNATYTATFDTATGLYTIGASGGGVTAFQLVYGDVAKRVLGFSATSSGALSYVSTRRCDYFIVGTEGGISEWSRFYEVDEDLLEELIGDDGTADIFAKSGAALAFDFEVPWEPAASIWTETAAGLWCWQDFFGHARTGAPFVVAVPGLTTTFVALIRSKTAAFRPKLLGDGYLAHASIQVSGFYLGAAT